MQHVILKDSRNGKGVFATEAIERGEIIMLFRGEIISSENMPNPYPEDDDHFVQVGENKYMGPSGGLDDFVNHSCEPNSGLQIDSEGVTLVAVKNIQPGEEITWDYSTTMLNDEWTMRCDCKSSSCRSQIREFKYLPFGLRNRYIQLGIVPKYVESK